VLCFIHIPTVLVVWRRTIARQGAFATVTRTLLADEHLEGRLRIAATEIKPDIKKLLKQ
jgi:hypothetical protein